MDSGVLKPRFGRDCGPNRPSLDRLWGARRSAGGLDRSRGSALGWVGVHMKWNARVSRLAPRSFPPCQPGLGFASRNRSEPERGPAHAQRRRPFRICAHSGRPVFVARLCKGIWVDLQPYQSNSRWIGPPPGSFVVSVACRLDRHLAPANGVCVVRRLLPDGGGVMSSSGRIVLQLWGVNTLQ